jgi:hypothetical protein
MRYNTIIAICVQIENKRTFIIGSFDDPAYIVWIKIVIAFDAVCACQLKFYILHNLVPHNRREYAGNHNYTLWQRKAVFMVNKKISNSICC